MSIIVSKYFDENYPLINTTADYNFIEYFKNNKQENIILMTNVEYENIITKQKMTDYFQEKYNMKLKNILVHDQEFMLNRYNWDNVDDVNFFIYIVDIHHDFTFELCPRYLDYTKKGKFNFILCYAYFWNLYNENFKPSRNIFFPHNVLFPSTININPINKILISGRGTNNIERYPNRNKIYGLSLYKTNKQYLEHFKPKLPYRIEKKEDFQYRVMRQNFINLLNRYLACFCDDGNPAEMPSIFAKFFEIMSSGSLLVTPNSRTKQYFEKLGFKDRVHYYSMTDDFMKDIKYVLDPVNREEVDRIRKAGYERVWKYHSSEARAKELINMFNNGFDNYETYEDGINGTIYMCNKDYLN